MGTANAQAQAVSLVKQSSGARTEFATGTDPTTVLLHDGLVWVAAPRGLQPLPPVAGEDLRVSTPRKLINLDPISRVFPMDEQLSYATCATLLEVAAATPSLSHDGRTYTFRIGRGVRFSPPSNEPVTAQTFRHTMERTLSRYAQGWDYAPDIVGAAAYKAGQGYFLPTDEVQR